MTKDELLAALQDFDPNTYWEISIPAIGAAKPWELLLDYIDDPEIRAAFEAIPVRTSP